MRALVLLTCLSCVAIFEIALEADENTQNSQDLSFFAVSSEAFGTQIDDSTIVRLRDKGYISKKADLSIHEIQSVQAIPFKTRMMNKDGVMEPVIKEALRISLKSDDTKRLASLTAENVGHQILILLNGKFLIAPIVREPILDGSLQIDFPKNADTDSIRKQLSLLVTK